MGDTNNHEQNIERIKEALGNPVGCEVTYIEATRTYAIAPQEGQEEVRISTIASVMHNNESIHLFQAFSFSFQKCVFESEILLEGTEIHNVLRFSKCTFNKNVDCIKATFRNFLSFSESTFEQHAFFTWATFSKGTQFLNNMFKGMVDFQSCHFNNETSFSRTIFEQKVSFSKTIFEQKVSFDNIVFHNNANFDNTEFHGEANFNVATFKMETSFLSSIFKKDIQFKGITFDKHVRFDGAEFGDSTKPIEEKSKYIANFLKATFNGEANFSNAHFYIPVDFSNTDFNDYTSFNGVDFWGEVNFMGTHFGGGAYFTSSSFKQNACFQGVTFHSNANFDHVKFQVGEDCESESIADFSGTRFQKTAELNATFGHDANFKGAIFNDNAHFDGAIFRGGTNFNLCHFYQATYFYGAIFQNISQYETLKDIPFYQTNFHSDVYLSSDLFDFEFEHLQTIIDQDKDNERSETKTNKLRQMFRDVKSSFIEEHNYLDAAHYHKMELYCKEIELGYRRDENVEKSGIRDIVDRIQLYCYRATSDHHTDLLLILNYVIFLIALFGVINFCLAIYTSNISFGGIVAKMNDTKNIAIVFSSLIFILFSIYFIFEYCKISNSEFRNSTLTVAILLAVFCYFIPDFALILTIAYYIVACLFVILLFVVILCRFSQKSKYIKKAIFILSYLNVLVMAFVSPSSILPVLGKLLEDKSSETCFSIFENMNIICSIDISTGLATLNLIYMLFLFLLLFSLQKTARKNTIVPN